MEETIESWDLQKSFSEAAPDLKPFGSLSKDIDDIRGDESFVVEGTIKFPKMMHRYET